MYALPHATVTQHQLNTGMLLTLPGLKPGCSASTGYGKFMYFDILAKHSPVSSEKCAALLSILKKKFENIFQDLKNIYENTVKKK